MYLFIYFIFFLFEKNPNKDSPTLEAAVIWVEVVYLAVKYTAVWQLKC